MTCGKSEARLWAELEQCDRHLAYLQARGTATAGPQPLLDQAGIKRRTAFDEWERHLRDPIPELKLTQDGDDIVVSWSNGDAEDRLGVSSSTLSNAVRDVAESVWLRWRPERKRDSLCEDAWADARRVSVPDTFAQLTALAKQLRH